MFRLNIEIIKGLITVCWLEIKTSPMIKAFHRILMRNVYLSLKLTRIRFVFVVGLN